MRLLKARDYERVFNGARKSSGQAFTVLARPSGRQLPRLGLAIPRKQIKKAVQRNRIKRVIRESFRHNQQLLRGLDVVVVAKHGIPAKSTQSLFECLERHWQRIRERCPCADDS